MSRTFCPLIQFAVLAGNFSQSRKLSVVETSIAEKENLYIADHAALAPICID